MSSFDGKYRRRGGCPLLAVAVLTLVGGCVLFGLLGGTP